MSLSLNGGLFILYSYCFEKAEHHCTPLVFTVVLMCISALRQSRCDQDDCANGFIGLYIFMCGLTYHRVCSINITCYYYILIVFLRNPAVWLVQLGVK